MKLKNIYIRKLFGTFDYTIEFENLSNPLIITGLNGFGKTTILTIINSLSKKDLFYFYNLSFEEIGIDFDHGHRLLIQSQKDVKEMSALEEETQDSNLTYSRAVSFNWFTDGKSISTVRLDRKSIHDAVRRMGFYRRTELPDMSFESDDFYRFVQANRELYLFFQEKDESRFIFMMLNSFKATFIEAQRVIMKKEGQVFGKNNSKFISCVSYVSSELDRILKEEQTNYLKKSQKAYDSIIDRLLNEEIDFDEGTYNKIKREIENKLTDLTLFNLVGHMQIKSYNEKQKHVLTVYLKDLQENLSVFNTILPKLQLFKNRIESLHFTNKSVSYKPEKGIVVQGADGKFLNIEKLSSGEQNEIIMLYYMIFEVADHTVLLIDEPEISLHVAWQNMFMQNLKEIANEKDLQVIVATHSPQIIGNRWRDCLDLCEILENE